MQNVNATSNSNTTMEEYLSLPPTTVLEKEGLDKIAMIQAQADAQKQSQYPEIRFKDGDTRILRFNPVATEWKEDTFKMEGQPEKKQWRYHFSCSEYMPSIGKWTQFKIFKLAPKWGNNIIANLKEGNLTLKVTRKGSGLETDYPVVVTSSAGSK